MHANLRLARFAAAAATALLFASLVLASPAMAQGRGPARGEMPTRPMLIEAIDTTRNTITIMETTYQIHESSRLYDADGNRLRLRDLRPRTQNDMGDMIVIKTGRARGDRGNVIRELRIVPVMMP